MVVVAHGVREHVPRERLERRVEAGGSLRRRPREPRFELGGGHADDRGPVGEHSLDEQIDRQVTDAAHLARREGEGVVP